jgi:hypothetical protein
MPTHTPTQTPYSTHTHPILHTPHSTVLHHTHAPFFGECCRTDRGSNRNVYRVVELIVVLNRTFTVVGPDRGSNRDFKKTCLALPCAAQRGVWLRVWCIA